MPTDLPRSTAANIALHDDDAYTAGLTDFVTASPTSYHAAAETAARLGAAGLDAVDETRPWDAGLPRRGYVVRDGAIIAWILPERCGERAGFRIIGAHTDSPALKLKPGAAMVRDGLQVLNVEVYGGPLLSSFLDRELGLATRLGITTVDVGQALLSMHSQREMCGVADGPWLARAMRAFWLGA